MKLLNISSGDQVGGRFNGFDVGPLLQNRGIESKLGCFWNHTSDDSRAFNVFPGEIARARAEFVRGLEITTGRIGHYQSWSRDIFDLAEFQLADVVHLQVVHDHFLSLETIVRILESKPSVWTWHDFWPLTGHCISPTKCPRWEKGCGRCPNLGAPLPVIIDRTAKEKANKESKLSKKRINVHVSTKWMSEKIKPYISSWDANVFQFPFGIDSKGFSPLDKLVAREKLGIGENDFVVFARQTSDPGKQFLEIVQALDKLSEIYPEILLITVQERGLVAPNSVRLRSLEFPWVDALENLVTVYSAADIFAMPSTVETFGMMALESMSCSVPVVTTKSSATAEVVNLPELEIDDFEISKGLAKVFEWALQNPDALIELGDKSRVRAANNFSLEQYVTNLSTMYRKIIDDFEIG